MFQVTIDSLLKCTYLTAIKWKAGYWWDIVLVIGNSILVKGTFMIHTHTYSMRSNGRNWVPVIAWTYLDPSCFLIRAISRSVSVSTHADIFYLEGHQFCDLTCSPLTQADWLTKLIEVFININKIIYVRYTVNLLHLAVYSSFLGKKWLLLNQVYCTLLNVMHTYM